MAGSLVLQKIQDKLSGINNALITSTSIRLGDLGEIQALKIQQRIRDRTDITYLFEREGGLFLASDENRGGIVPLNYAARRTETGQIKISLPEERLERWLLNERFPASGAEPKGEKNVFASALEEGGEWRRIFDFTNRPGLFGLYARSLLLQTTGNPLSANSERKRMVEEINVGREPENKLNLYPNKSTAFSTEALKYVIPMMKSGQTIISKAKRLKIFTSGSSNVFAGGRVLQYEEDPIQIGQTPKQRGIYMKRALDLFSEHPEGAAFARPNLLFGDPFDKTVKVTRDVTLNEKGELVYKGKTISAGFYGPKTFSPDPQKAVGQLQAFSGRFWLRRLRRRNAAGKRRTHF